MARDWQAYRRLLRSLLPRGRAWQPDVGFFAELLGGMAVELARIDARIDDLMREASTLTASELLPEFELDYGLLNDPSLDLTKYSNSGIQAILNMRLRSLGSLRPNYYVDLAAAYGITVTIDEFTPMWAGLGVCGEPCGDQQNIFYWRVNVVYNLEALYLDALAEGTILADGAEFAGLLSAYLMDYSYLATLFEKLKPVHTVVLWKSIGPAFSDAFSNDFDSMPKLAFRAFDSAFDGSFS